MPLTIRTKQVLGVTLLVGLIVVPLSAWYAASMVRRMLNETLAPATLVKETVLQRLYDISTEPDWPQRLADAGGDPIAALRVDPGLRTIVQATGVFSKHIVSVAITDTRDAIVLSSLGESYVGQTATPSPPLSGLLSASLIDQWRELYGGEGTYEIREDLQLLDGTRLGSIRIGISTLLIRAEFNESVRTPLLWAAVALAGSILVAMLLAQLIVRPIHVIRSGLARLGRGELDAGVDLPTGADLADLGDSFKAISARLAADRTELAGQRATLESLVDVLEDAVALFSTDGTLLFANPAMHAAFSGHEGTIATLLPPDHPYRVAVERVLAEAEQKEAGAEISSPASGPQIVDVPDGGERLVLAHEVADARGHRLGVLLVARNLAYLSQVQSTLNYSRKLAALSRLSAGIAHEVKNPLNATMIHLELLKMQLADRPTAAEHLQVIAAQVRRLDEVVQGFLKFSRPEDLKLQPVSIAHVVGRLLPIVRAEAERTGIDVRTEFPDQLPPVSGDPALLEQALLNLALNACQAMPHGGRLRIAASAAVRGQVEVIVEDTGVGIPPEHLERIFDLYFTTREHGSGIGLSLVYRTVQLHDGDIEVQSTPGHGTTFRIRLPQAWGHVYAMEGA
jgi:signal transduction histidine kinase